MIQSPVRTLIGILMLPSSISGCTLNYHPNGQSVETDMTATPQSEQVDSANANFKKEQDRTIGDYKNRRMIRIKEVTDSERVVAFEILNQAKECLLADKPEDIPSQFGRSTFISCGISPIKGVQLKKILTTLINNDFEDMDWLRKGLKYVGGTVYDLWSTIDSLKLKDNIEVLRANDDDTLSETPFIEIYHIFDTTYLLCLTEYKGCIPHVMGYYILSIRKNGIKIVDDDFKVVHT